MDFSKITPGVDAPHDINVIIEIPTRGEPVKYEVDKYSGTLNVDRFFSAAMYYPTNYGYVPQTLSEDGDPVDVLVITPVPLIPGAVIRSRPVGMLAMTDESGKDAKILAVPIDKLSTEYRHIQCPEDISPVMLSAITHFFEHYKDLEDGKWVRVDGWKDVAAAKKEILSSIQRFK